MPVENIEKFWKERSAGITTNLIKLFVDCDEKYIKFFISDEKFLRLMKVGSNDGYIRSILKDFGNRLFTIGFESQNPAFLKACAISYKNSGETFFLPPAAKEIFLF
jgi:hypothetical protein